MCTDVREGNSGLHGNALKLGSALRLFDASSLFVLTDGFARRNSCLFHASGLFVNSCFRKETSMSKRGAADLPESSRRGSRAVIRDTSLHTSIGTHPQVHSSMGTHHVFISHRGLHMKRTFANHLYHALKKEGIKAFLDMKELPPGRDVRQNMLAAARRAIIQVPIFTPSYGSSHWCLDELLEMMHSSNTSSNAKVIPVYYNIKSEELRKDDGLFATNFQEHLNNCKHKHNEERIKLWKDALHKASWLEGFRLETYNQCEGDLIEDLVKEIVKEISKRLPVEVVPNAVGLEQRVPDVIQRFRLEKKPTVYFVLLWGMGGIGKTTVARAVYLNLRKEFAAASFVENCRVEKSSRIQDRLRKDLLLDENDLGGDIAQGKARLKDGLREKKVLIVLDDVKDNFDSIEEVIDPRSLEVGSRILVTSRDLRVFPHENCCSRVFGGEHYELPHMDSDHSLQLFCLHAFKKPSPDPSFEELATKVVEYCHGLSLSLEVLGSHLSTLGRHLSTTKKKKLWEEAIRKLRSNQHEGISGRLMISYEALDKDEQQMFLDVACFLIGEPKWRAKYFWDGLVDGWRSGLQKLIELCLVKVGKEKRLTMHDQLRDLGRGIDKREFRRTRLWNDEDLLEVLQSNQGLDQIRGLATSLPTLNAGLLSQMRSLRLLFLRGTDLVGDRERLKALKIKWLKWSDLPILPKELDLDFLTVLEIKSTILWHKVIQIPFQLREVSLPMNMAVKIDLMGSRCKLQRIKYQPLELPQNFGSLKSLKELDVSGSWITKLPPSFGQLKRLQVLKMCSCKRLEELPDDFGSLESLEELDVSSSCIITKLPPYFGQLKRLQVLKMYQCEELEELSEDFGSLERLEELEVSYSCIIKLPPSFGQLKRLRVLKMYVCKRLEELPEDFGSLESLEELEVSYSPITKLPPSFMQLKRLRVLRMNDSCITKLPPSFGQLKRLQELTCGGLEELPEDFGSLESLEVFEVSRPTMTKLPASFGQLKRLRVLKMYSCYWLEELSEDFGSLESLEELEVSYSPTTKLPASFGQLKRLRVLRMNDSCITELPPSFRQLKRLRVLAMNDCLRLEELPEDFGSLESLEELDVSRSCITKLPPSFRQLKKLRVLRMNDCRRLEDFGSLESLEELDVFGASSTKLPPSLRRKKAPANKAWQGVEPNRCSKDDRKVNY